MSPGNPTPEYLRDAQGTERKILAPGPSRPRSFSHQNLSIFFLFFFLFKLISMPNVGLRLTTWRSRVPCLTHRTSQHPRILAIFFYSFLTRPHVSSNLILCTWSHTTFPWPSHRTSLQGFGPPPFLRGLPIQHPAWLILPTKCQPVNLPKAELQLFLSPVKIISFSLINTPRSSPKLTPSLLPV